MPTDSPKVFLPNERNSSLRITVAVVCAVLLGTALFGFWYLRKENITSASPVPAAPPAQPAEIVAPVVNIPPLQPPPTLPTPEPVAAGLAEKTLNVPIDLLKLIEPERDAVAGNWTRKDDGIVSDVAPYARLQVPYAVPENTI